jgi:hypothetical protein
MTKNTIDININLQKENITEEKQKSILKIVIQKNRLQHVWHSNMFLLKDQKNNLK